MVRRSGRADRASPVDRLRRERKAVILAHYYQDPDIQDLADHLGDSLELAKRARDAKDAEVILFCGVHFMAETAKIVNPSKIVIIPDLKATSRPAVRWPSSAQPTGCARGSRSIPSTTS
jgi:quinolinate synthase